MKKKSELARPYLAIFQQIAAGSLLGGGVKRYHASQASKRLCPRMCANQVYLSQCFAKVLSRMRGPKASVFHSFFVKRITKLAYFTIQVR
jgi:hypothetical protein